MYKKRDARAELLFCQFKPIAFLPFSLTSPSSLLKLPYVNNYRDRSITLSIMSEQFSYDLEMKTREQNKNNKRTEIKRFDWFIERIQTHLAFGWLSERSAEKTSCPKNFLEIALTSYCNTIGQSNNAFSISGFSLAGKRRVHVLFFSSIG